ncbi:MAG: pyridoxal-phosphate dependent enzyme [candidate division KSB1 bacterium]|nr:pyridoxal-phosphate dependent enzyme [candidate division KSB1 bacterium]MDZ7356987.1 pyridoxal-phosphate dependent enzyme [candidate division KSB1 bacterium]MDZ7400951.1 pyridoxal-phosphate dependent enzyme [candidate division KSB1 bacterium]
MGNQPTIEDLRAAQRRIAGLVHRTPVLTCTTLNEMTGAQLFFKCENFQKVGAFKFRGACNAVFSLPENEAAKGVVTHSSGNHAAALSLAARKRGIPARIVMPSNAPAVKIAAVKNYGGQITFCEPTQLARETAAAEIIKQTGAVMIHPYNNETVIAGQGTAALELLEDVPDLEYILAPVGGGGLLSGTAIAARSSSKNIKVIGCEPKNADDAYRSIKAGKIIPPVHPNTIADGLKTSLGEKTFPIIQQLVDEIVLVSEEQIILAMRHIFERMKVIIEPSSAVPFGALLSGKLNLAGKKVGIIISGGNVDLSKFFDLLSQQVQSIEQQQS